MSWPYKLMIGSHCFVSKRQCLIYRTGTNRRSLPPYLLTQTHWNICYYFGRREGSAGNRGRGEDRGPLSRWGVGVWLLAWARPLHAAEDAFGICATSCSSTCVTAYRRRRLLRLLVSWTPYSAGVLVMDVHRSTTLPCFHQHRPAGAHVTAAFVQSHCAYYLRDTFHNSPWSIKCLFNWQ